MASPISLFLATLALFLLLACSGDTGPVSQVTSTAPPVTVPTATPATPQATAAPARTIDVSFTPSPGLAGDAFLGAEIFQSYGCNACHSNDGTALVGPTWLGLYGTEEQLEDGTAILVDETYIVESIKDPNAKITKGFTGGLMPATLGVTDDEILHIIEYMKSLR